jgi:hypothetical protein
MSPRWWLVGLLVLLTVCGCSSGTRTVRVAVPPRVVLGAYPMIGLVTFSSNTGGDDLDGLSTQKFLTELQSAQPGTRVIELGREADVLASVNAQSWDPAALRALKTSRGVDAIVLGRFDARRVAPDVRLSTLFKSFSVKQDVNASLSAKLVETATGATVWTDAAQTTATVAGAHVNARGQGSFGATDPEAAYGQMLSALACRVTDDFREHYVLRRVPKDQVTVASAE